jgi:hypothetical protein
MLFLLIGVICSIAYSWNKTVLVVALEKVERSSGTLIGSSIATIQKSAAPEVDFRNDLT